MGHRRNVRAEMNTNGTQRKEAGCTCTFEAADGKRITMHRFGSPTGGVRDMCETALAADPTYRLISYSTPESIHSDITGARADGQGPENTTARRALPEQLILGRIRMLHMLHPRLVMATPERRLENARARRQRDRDAA